VSITNDKLLLFRSHECSRGLSDEAQQEISDAAQLVQIGERDYLHHAGEVITSVYLIVHGRLKQSIVDMHGNVLLQRFLTCGSQFGGLAAAQVDPVPVDVVAVEPSAALKFDFETFLRFTREHEVFGLNLTRSVSKMVSQVLLSDRRPKRPPIVTVFHESPGSRPLTQRLVRRLLELGETPCVMSDTADWDPIENISYRSLIEDGHPLSREEFRRQITQWSDSGRIIIDVDASLDPDGASLLVEFSEQVLWCSSSGAARKSIDRIKAIEACSPGWRDKINLVWMLEDDTRVAPPVPQLGELVKRDFKISFSAAKYSFLTSSSSST
jgi:NTE family protein